MSGNGSLCWICGQVANSKEHLIKASDLKSMFGEVSQESPLRYHDNIIKNVPIKSYNNVRLKSKIPLCENCNTSRTQPHDKSWTILSTELRKRLDSSGEVSKLRASRVFPYCTRTHLLNVHLFMLKHFGCRIVDHDVPIDVAPFRKAILEEKHCPNVFLRFGHFPDAYTGVPAISIREEDGKAVVASTFYGVGCMAVNILYAVDLEITYQGMVDAYHPNKGTTLLKIFNFGDETE